MNHHYQKISEAIEFIENHFSSQPSLNEIAEHLHISPSHFQKIFSEWAGISPKKFLQYISIQHAKSLLRKEELNLFDTAHLTGLSSTSRLHDMFIQIEGMTPAEYKNEGKNLQINYQFASSPFGEVIIASTHKGICHLAFYTDAHLAMESLKNRFPKANFLQQSDLLQENALKVFQSNWTNISRIKLHLKGTDFQIKVWECLLKIPMSQLSTYGDIAVQIQNPKASRAVGSAIGSNPIAFLIPCHRVIQSSGAFGGYMWGSTRKKAIVAWEAAQKDLESKF